MEDEDLPTETISEWAESLLAAHPQRRVREIWQNLESWAGIQEEVAACQQGINNQQKLNLHLKERSKAACVNKGINYEILDFIAKCWLNAVLRSCDNDVSNLKVVFDKVNETVYIS